MAQICTSFEKVSPVGASFLLRIVPHTVLFNVYVMLRCTMIQFFRCHFGVPSPPPLNSQLKLYVVIHSWIVYHRATMAQHTKNFILIFRFCDT